MTVQEKPQSQLLSEIASLRQKVAELETAPHSAPRDQGRDQTQREFMDCSPVPMVLIDKEERFLFLNQSFISTLGYTLQDLPDVDAWWSQVYPDQDYRQAMKERWQAACQASATSQGQAGAGRLARVRCKDGTFKHVEIHGANLGRESLVVYLDVSAKVRAENRQTQLIAELEAALADVKQLSGLLPICAHCKKIRDSEQYWSQVEVYISEHTGAQFTHSICPDCARKLYPDFYDK